MAAAIEKLRARLMSTQKEKIALLEEKLTTLSAEEAGDDRNEELEETVAQQEKCLHNKGKEIDHLKRMVATGRMDGTGTDYKAELAKARKERGDANRTIKRMEREMEQLKH